jgi:F-type H+-transporting ATPase subunit epsilon
VRLLITDPLSVVAEHDDVVSLRAEDESGGFGVLNGCADLLTTLALSVISWHHADGRVGYCAVRRGVLTVQGGREVLVATREAHLGDDLDALERTVLAGYRSQLDAERETRTAAAKLRTRAIRQIVQALRAGGTGGPGLRP